jgi:hypothetical protein
MLLPAEGEGRNAVFSASLGWDVYAFDFSSNAREKAQLNNNTGGPKNINMLYSVEELKEDFSQLSELNVWEEEVELYEGDFHSGKSAVIRLIGKK